MTLNLRRHAAGIFVGVLCGAARRVGLGGRFRRRQARHTIGFTPADLAFHRFFWAGLLLMPLALRDGISDLGGIGWGRGMVMTSGRPAAGVRRL